LRLRRPPEQLVAAATRRLPPFFLVVGRSNVGLPRRPPNLFSSKSRYFLLL
jgi:hypothetical protein